MTIPSQDLKICSQCGEAKPLSEYYRLKSGSYVAECKVCALKRRVEYYKRNHAEIRRRDNEAMRIKRQRIKDAVFNAYGGYKCACCGETEPLFLTIDHINNDGAEHRRKLTGKRHSAGYHTYIWLYKNNFPEGFQVLCMNCNHGKRMNNGICPHQVRCNDQSKDVELSSSKRIAPQAPSGVGEDMVCSA